jgi:DNA polymerase-3 subunit epsilon/exodeoxyribonuclease X
LLVENTDDEDMIHTIKALNIGTNDKKEYKPYNNDKKPYQKPTNSSINNPKLIEVMPFGKYKGEKLVDICEKNMEYIDWMLENTDNENFKKELEYSVDKLINE